MKRKADACASVSPPMALFLLFLPRLGAGDGGFRRPPSPLCGPQRAVRPAVRLLRHHCRSAYRGSARAAGQLLLPLPGQRYLLHGGGMDRRSPAGEGHPHPLVGLLQPARQPGRLHLCRRLPPVGRAGPGGRTVDQPAAPGPLPLAAPAGGRNPAVGAAGPAGGGHRGHRADPLRRPQQPAPAGEPEQPSGRPLRPAWGVDSPPRRGAHSEGPPRRGLFPPAGKDHRQPLCPGGQLLQHPAPVLYRRSGR